MLEWLSGWGGDEWSAAGTWGTVLIGLGAVVFARGQVKEARHLREAQAQPFVVVSLEQSQLTTSIANLVIENVGNTLARDVRIKFDPPFPCKLNEGSDGLDLDYDLFATKGFASMPPGYRYERIVDDMKLWKEDELAKVSSTVTVTYSDFRGQTVDPLTYVLDFEALITGTYIEAKTMNDLVFTLRDIRRLAEKWTAFGGGLDVWARDGDALDQRKREAIAEARQERERKRAEEADSDGSDSGSGGGGRPTA